MALRHIHAVRVTYLHSTVNNRPISNMPRLVSGERGPVSQGRGEGKVSSRVRDISGGSGRGGSIKDRSSKEKSMNSSVSSGSIKSSVLNNKSSSGGSANLISRNSKENLIGTGKKGSREHLDRKDSKDNNNSTGNSITDKHNASFSSKNSGNDAAWTPPLWITKEKHPHRSRNLNFPIPPVPGTTRKAIQKYIEKQQPPYRKQEAQIQLLQNKLKGHKEKVKHAQQKLQKLEESKAERIQEIRVLREEAMEVALLKVQQEIKQEHEAAAKQREEEWKQNTEREIKAAKRQFKKEQTEMDEKERELYNKKIEEEKKALQRKPSVEDGEVDDDDEKNLLPSQQLERELGKSKDRLDQLKDTKSEMVWLLKQVIKTEKKRKATDALVDPPQKKQIKL